MTEYRLEAQNICKSFPGVRALDQVSLSLAPGEVLAVIGENGAGKSTLMKILAGIQSADSGEIRVAGRRTLIESVSQASLLGIALIHQELNLCDNLSVAENVYLGREPRFLGLVNQNAIDMRATPFLQQVGLDVSPTQVVRELSVGQQQMVEIAKALSTGAKILIMDEPTSSLTHQETEKLYAIVDRLRQQGISIIYISHRLPEVIRLADRVEVLRDGRNVGSLVGAEITRDAMVERMVGRQLDNFYLKRDFQATGKKVALSIRGLRTLAFPAQTNDLEIRQGEIVGLAGLVGSGRTEVLTTIFGVTECLGGQLSIDSQPLPAGEIRAAIASGIALVPEDRKLQGIFLEMAIRWNASLAVAQRLAVGQVFLNAEANRRTGDELSQKMRVKAADFDVAVGTLSGGNQQKVVLAKWLATEPKVLLLDEPTRGVDVGSRQEIYDLIGQLSESGVAILFVSSEMEELFGLADRVLVMHEGSIMGELDRASFDEATVMRLATGQTVPATALPAG